MYNRTIRSLNIIAKQVANNILTEIEVSRPIPYVLGGDTSTPHECVRVLVRDTPRFFNGVKFANENGLRNLRKTSRHLNYLASEVLARLRRDSSLHSTALNITIGC